MKVNRKVAMVSAGAAAVLVLGACGGSSSQEAAAGGESAATSACPIGAVDESITTTARIAYQKIPNVDLRVSDLGFRVDWMP